MYCVFVYGFIVYILCFLWFYSVCIVFFMGCIFYRLLGFIDGLVAVCIFFI
jgi:hypothetical protein